MSRERKLNLKVSIFQLKQTFRVSEKHNNTHFLRGFDINFLENA